MKDFASLIDAFGSTAAFAAAIGVTPSHVRVMKCRRSVPTRYWPILIKAAGDYGVEGITFETLFRLATKSAKPPSRPSPSKERRVA